MKKQLTVALGLAVLATPAFATKARLQALGEDSYGSFYVNDNRNIWLNAAQINNHKDLVTYEFGTENTTDNAETPRGEGGVYKSMGNMTYGLHFGGASNTSNGLRAAAGVTSANETNNIDAFVGGDAGLKWGANLGYSKNANENRAAGVSSEALRTRLGVIMGDTQGYANINLINRAKGLNSGSNKFEGDLGYQIGAIHAWNGNSLFADYRSFTAEATNSGTKNDLGFKQLQVGIGRVERLNDKTNLFVKASYVNVNAENDRLTGINTTFGTTATSCGTGAAAILCEKYKGNSVPVVVGLETDATSWLTLRASIQQTIWGVEKDKSNERTFADSTEVNAGASLKFGEFTVDGVIGNDTDGNTTAARGTDSGTIRTDSLMSRVAMTYRF